MKKNKKWESIILIIVIVVILTIIGYFLYKKTNSKSGQNNVIVNNNAANTSTVNELNNDTDNTASKPPDVSLLDGYQLYNGADYFIQYKNDWTIDMSNDSEDTMIFLAPDGATSVSVVTEPLAINYTLEQYIKNSPVSNMKAIFSISDSNITKENISINGINACRLAYKINANMAIMQTVLIKNKTGYVITYNNVGDYADVYHNMENTFTIK